MRTSETTQIIRGQFEQVYRTWKETSEERDGLKKEIGELENDFTK